MHVGKAAGDINIIMVRSKCPPSRERGGKDRWFLPVLLSLVFGTKTNKSVVPYEASPH